MAAPISKADTVIFLLLKVIEAQKPVNALDATKTSENWPAAAGASLTARAISDRLRDTKKDAIKKGLVDQKFTLPCSNYCSTKSKGSGKRGRAPISKEKGKEGKGDGDEDVMEMTGEDLSRIKKTKIGLAATTDPEYPSPPSTGRIKSSSTLVAAASTAAAAPKGFQPTNRTTCEAREAQIDNNPIYSDSDSDSLADLEDTPTKAPTKTKRTMPTRRSRAVKKSYADDDVVGAGGPEESDDEFDPFRLREEQQKKDARRYRGRRWANEYDSDE